ncbi:unnamed protein product, partial [Effrenium voratum]
CANVGMLVRACHVLAGVLHVGGAVSSSRPPLFDYDCASVRRRLTRDWESIHQEVEAVVQLAQAGGPLPHPPRRSGRILLQEAAEAAQECPLGLLNLAVIHFFTAHMQNTEEDPSSRAHVMQVAAHFADAIASEFPVHVICSSRWPIFEAIEMFTLHLDKDVADVPRNVCDDISNGVVNWKQLRAIANEWSQLQWVHGSRSPEVIRMLLVMTSFMEESAERWEQALKECPVGSAFLAAVQATTAVAQLTHQFDEHSRLLDKTIHEGLLSAVSCGWPLGHVLAVLSDSNKGLRYADRNYKYVRKFADLDLHLEELSPLVPPPQHSMAATAWRQQGAKKALAIARLPWHGFARILHRKAGCPRKHQWL